MRSLFKLIAIGAVSAAAACEPTETVVAPDRGADPHARAQPEQRADLRAEEGSPDLFGAWIVEGVGTSDTQAQAEPWDTVLLVGLNQLEVLSQCVTIGPFDYHRTGGGGIAVRQATGTSRARPANVPTPTMCTRGLTSRERVLGPLLLAAQKVTVAKDGTISLLGPAGTLTARRPAGPLRNPRAYFPAPRLPPLLGAWRFVSVNGRMLPASQRMELLLRPRYLEWRSGCIHEARQLAATDNRLIPGEIEPLGVCERMETEAEKAVGRMVANPVAIRREQDGRLRLHGSEVTAELEPLTR
jgi:hypothetical protein